MAANHVRLNGRRFLPAWTGYSGFFGAGDRKWMPLCSAERGNWQPDWIPLFHYPEKRFTLRFRGGILPSMCLLAACMEVAVKNQPGFCLAGVPKEILLPVFFCRTDVYDNEAERPGNGYTALEGRPSGRVFANASGILPESHCFCQLNRPPAEMADEQRKAVGSTTFDDLVTGKRDSQWTVTERWRRARSVLKTWPGRHIG